MPRATLVGIMLTAACVAGARNPEPRNDSIGTSGSAAETLFRRLHRDRTLDELFPEFHPGNDGQPLMIVAGSEPPGLPWILTAQRTNDPFALRWVARLATCERAAATEEIRNALAERGPMRAAVITGLELSDSPREIPVELLRAFGAPRDPHERQFLRARYEASIAAACSFRQANDVTDAGALLAAWDAGFPSEPAPMAPEDLAVIRHLLDPGRDRPSFVEMISFFATNGRFDWAEPLRSYAEDGEWPSNGVSLICRASAGECADLLRSPPDNVALTAADVAPALDLPGGDIVLATACDRLDRLEARSLAERGRAAGLPDDVHDTAALCLELVGHDDRELGMF